MLIEPVEGWENPAMPDVVNTNSNIDGMIGKAFLHDKFGSILNHYNLPYLNYDDPFERLLKYNKVGGLAYYTVFRTEKFMFICNKVKKLKDDNLCEVLFNYIAALTMNIVKCQSVFLAREYPRPKVYNIPCAEDWITSKFITNSIKNFIKLVFAVM